MGDGLDEGSLAFFSLVCCRSSNASLLTFFLMFAAMPSIVTSFFLLHVHTCHTCHTCHTYPCCFACCMNTKETLAKGKAFLRDELFTSFVSFALFLISPYVLLSHGPPFPSLCYPFLPLTRFFNTTFYPFISLFYSHRHTSPLVFIFVLIFPFFLSLHPSPFSRSHLHFLSLSHIPLYADGCSPFPLPLVLSPLLSFLFFFHFNPPPFPLAHCGNPFAFFSVLLLSIHFPRTVSFSSPVSRRPFWPFCSLFFFIRILPYFALPYPPSSRSIQTLSPSLFL